MWAAGRFGGGESCRETSQPLVGTLTFKSGGDFVLFLRVAASALAEECSGGAVMVGKEGEETVDLAVGTSL
tara:strand:+ start:136 stop:348 length:213 start_codon:yes stop_codon:yes gene_type:complete